MKLFRQFLYNFRELYQDNIQEELEEADAIILELHPTGSTRNGMSEVHMLLQVMPRSGRNYVAEYNTYFTNAYLQELQSGTKTKIYFRHNEPSKIRSLKNGTS